MLEVAGWVPGAIPVGNTALGADCCTITCALEPFPNCSGKVVRYVKGKRCSAAFPGCGAVCNEFANVVIGLGARRVKNPCVGRGKSGVCCAGVEICLPLITATDVFGAVLKGLEFRNRVPEAIEANLIDNGSLSGFFDKDGDVTTAGVGIVWRMAGVLMTNGVTIGVFSAGVLVKDTVGTIEGTTEFGKFRCAIVGRCPKALEVSSVSVLGCAVSPAKERALRGMRIVPGRLPPMPEKFDCWFFSGDKTTNVVPAELDGSSKFVARLIICAISARSF